MSILEFVAMMAVTVLKGGCFTPLELVESGRVRVFAIDGRTLDVQAPFGEFELHSRDRFEAGARPVIQVLLYPEQVAQQ